MDRKAYTYPALSTIIFVPEQIIAGSPLSGSTESLFQDGSFETPSDDNDGNDMGW